MTDEWGQATQCNVLMRLAYKSERGCLITMGQSETSNFQSMFLSRCGAIKDALSLKMEGFVLEVRLCST